MRRGDLTRLIRILGMLGSDHDGERAAAALAADRLVRGSGWNWSDLLAPARVSRPVRAQPVDPLTDRLAARIRGCGSCAARTPGCRRRSGG
ncbi:hypothetical protein QFZ27_003740 [Inquilinus ginsengisoli]|uniref:hypothetical protein n=1 Tax=Inquilinus ginsengisoli TaxID=363840 RepID=UPI003D22B955